MTAPVFSALACSSSSSSDSLTRNSMSASIACEDAWEEDVFDKDKVAGDAGETVCANGGTDDVTRDGVEVR